jgi:neurotransmitter:Na+ symporter, NSS family
MKKRNIWDNRMGFVLAAIGSAIGLGNVWRFPYVCYRYGGGAFLIPYFIALFTTGIPLMILEFSLGNKSGSGAPDAIAQTRKGWEWLGWLALLVAFVITIYYSVIIGWCLNYVGFSFTQAWADNPGDFFYQSFLKLSDNHFTMGSIQPWIFLGLLITWGAMVASIWKGVKSLSKVVYFVVLIPWLILILFLLRGVTLPGAFTGLNFFLRPDFSALKNLEVWTAAYTQAFFSLSLGFGVMIAYSSFLPKQIDLVNNAYIISLLDATTAFVGGLVVFSTLGYYAHSTGLPVDSVIEAGPSLVFVTYPTIISLLPVMSRTVGVLFFFMLFLLGLGSAFSLVESVVTGLMDKFQTKRLPTLLCVTATGFGAGLFFCTSAGLLWLDVIDHFMNQFGLMTVCLLLSVFAGWSANTAELRQYVNEFSEMRIGRWWDYLIKYLIPVILSILLLSWLNQRIADSYSGYSRGVEFFGGWIFVFYLPVISLFIMGANRLAFLMTGLFTVSLAVSIAAYHRGLDFPSLAIFMFTFIILIGGSIICLGRSRTNPRAFNNPDSV